jgi:hypothetical protein
MSHQTDNPLTNIENGITDMGDLSLLGNLYCDVINVNTTGSTLGILSPLTISNLVSANLGLTVTGANTSVTTLSSSGLATLNSLTVTNTSTLSTINASGIFTNTNTTNSTTTATGSIHTAGGLGVALNSFFGGTINVAGLLSATLGLTVTGANTSVTTLSSSGLATLNSLTVTGATIHNGTETFNGSVTVSGTNTVTLGTGLFTTSGLITNLNTSTNPTSGSITNTASLNLSGGLAFTGTSGMKGNISFAVISDYAEPTNTTLSTGTRLNLFPAVSAGSPGYNIGIGTSSMWFSVDTTAKYNYYVGDGTSNPFLLMKLDITALRLYSTTPILNNSNGVNAGFLLNCAIGLTGTTSYTNVIMFNPVNNAEPTSLSIRSVGCKLLLWPNNGLGSDYAIGIGSNSMWYQVDTVSSHNFYCGITNIGLWNTTALYINTDLSTGGFISGLSIINSNMQLYIYEDQNQTTTNVLQLSGNASYLQSNYIQLTPATATKTGYASFQQDPGSSWTLQFDYFYGTGTGGDGLQFFIQQPSLPLLRNNSGGWGLCFDELNNTIVGMSPAQTTTSSVGKTSVTLTTWVPTSTWTTIIISFQKGTFRVYINNVYVSGLTFTQLPVGQPSATFFGFVGYNNTSTNVHRIRNVRLEKGVGNCVPNFGSSTTWSMPVGVINIANTTVSSSTSTGSLVTPGGIGIGSDSYFGGMLVNIITTKIATNDISLTNIDGAVNFSGDLVFSNGTSQMIGFTSGGLGNPSFTNRTLGTKIILKPTVNGTQTDSAIGVNTSSVWISNGLSTGTIEFYLANVLEMSLNSTTLSLPSTTTSTTTSTGSLVVGGGAGFGGNVFIGGTTNSAGIINATSGTASTTTGTGALVISGSGGLGVGGNVNIGGTLTVNSISVGIFGSQYQSSSSLTTSSNTTTTPANKISFTTTSLPIGNYMINYYYELNIVGTTPTAICNVKIGATTYHTFSGTVITRQPICGYFLLNVASPATQTIVLSFALGGGTGSPSLTIQNAYINVFRVS